MRQLKISKSITNRDASLDKYLQEISREQQITVDEEVELAQRIRPRVTRCRGGICDFLASIFEFFPFCYYIIRVR